MPAVSATSPTVICVFALLAVALAAVGYDKIHVAQRVFAYGMMAHYTMLAAEKVAREDGIDAEVIDLRTLLPVDKGYYTFQGSLTTPPCSEGVRWFVLKTPMTLAANELTAFAKLYPMNARPTQPLNGRAVEATR